MNTYQIIDNQVWCHGVLMLEADAGSFEELSGWYGKDKNHVYYKYDILPELNPETIRILSGDFLADDQRVYFSNNLLERDLPTLEILDHGFHKDKNGVYYYSAKVKQADPVSFKSLNCNYGVDAYHAFCGETLLAEADIQNFTALSHCFAKDQRQVYYFSSVLKKADAATFALFDSPKNSAGCIGRDKNFLFHGESVFLDVDRDTFELIDGWYNKDRHHVYHFTKKLLGIDPVSFYIFNETYIADKNHIYTRNFDTPKIICKNHGDFKDLGRGYYSTDKAVFHIDHKEAISPHIDSFERLGNSAWATDNEYVFFCGDKVTSATKEQITLFFAYIKIKEQLYYMGVDKPIEEVDVATFEELYHGFAKDQHRLYYEMEPIENSDPDSFRYVDKDLYADNRQVYHIEYYDGYGMLDIIEGIDTSKFRRLERGYFTDDQSVYFYEHPLPEADPSTFEILAYGYSRDHSRVYYREKLLPGLNTNQLQIIHHCIASDQNQVFYEEQRLDLELAELKILDEHYILDNHKVYRDGQLLEGTIDAASFSKINNFFYRDKNHIYHHNYPLDLDPDKTVIYDETYAVDGRKVYFLEHELTKLSANTFEVLKYNFARDHQYVYYREDWIEGADAATFEVVSYSQYRDKNHQYKIRYNKVSIDE
ncbi:DKNYY domain-containing protein [Rapidithrix thailandica]|uniref:DKNYY domain-containing protein n=1 Tax=Rapidithrix thailandica TaxID=413964 RepID=A0AAW9S8Y6_9BACT